jgi:hypothetical protein
VLHAEHEPEASCGTRLYTRLGVLDDDRALRLGAESPRGLEEHRGVGLAGQAELGSGIAVDTHVEKRVHSGGGQHAGSVA